MYCDVNNSYVFCVYCDVNNSHVFSVYCDVNNSHVFSVYCDVNNSCILCVQQNLQEQIELLKTENSSLMVNNKAVRVSRDVGVTLEV